MSSRRPDPVLQLCRRISKPALSVSRSGPKSPDYSGLRYAWDRDANSPHKIVGMKSIALSQAQVKSITASYLKASWEVSVRSGPTGIVGIQRPETGVSLGHGNKNNRGEQKSSVNRNGSIVGVAVA